jgi:hypothetical protein
MPRALLASRPGNSMKKMPLSRMPLPNGMVFTIGPRVLPAFCGMRILWSKRLMFWSFLLLYIGCFLRVAAEPLAYASLCRHGRSCHVRP